MTKEKNEDVHVNLNLLKPAWGKMSQVNVSGMSQKYSQTEIFDQSLCCSFHLIFIVLFPPFLLSSDLQ